MKVPTLRSFCCCCSLRAGCHILGWLGTIIAPIVICVYLIFYLNVSKELKQFEESPPVPSTNRSDFILRNGEDLKTMYQLSFGAWLFVLVASIFLIFGTIKRNANHIKQWLYFAFPETILFFVVSLYIYWIQPEDKKYVAAIVGPIYFLIHLGIKAYFWLVVYSAYDMVQRGEPIA